MLGQKINEIRMAMGWNQVDLAKRLGVAKQTVSNWENENIQPSIEMLIRIANIFNVSTDYLLGLDEVPSLKIQGLPVEVVAHLSMLIKDFRSMQGKNDQMA